MWRSISLSLALACGLSVVYGQSTVPDMENAYVYHSVYDYAGHLEFTVTQGVGTNVFENFPLYVTVRDNSRGFNYSDLMSSTNDVRFFDSAGRVLNYEIAAWNTSGESAFWVLVPSLRQGSVITMCWNLRQGCDLPANDPLSVWSEYVGVWHMDETITAATAGETVSADATGNGLDAEPHSGEDGDVAAMTSVAGVFGNARVNDTASRNGNFLSVADVGGLLNLGNAFTLSMWLKVDGNSNGNSPVVTRRQNASAANGYQICLDQGDRGGFILSGKGTETNATIRVMDGELKDVSGFSHFCFTYEGTNASIYVSGAFRGRGAIDSVNDVAGDALGFGNRLDGAETSLWGKYDEVRLYKGLKSPEWIAIENAQGTNALTTTGWTTNDAAAVLQNTWKKEPSITKTSWEVGTYPTKNDIVFEPAHGTKDDETVIFYDRTTGNEVARGTGWDYGAVIPRTPGEYRVVLIVAQNDCWGELQYTLEYRIATNGGEQGFGTNVDRILLMNDDDSVSDGKVEWQAYSDEYASDELPYWKHLDEQGNDASSTPPSGGEDDDWSVVENFNLGGGTRHVYHYRDQVDWLWFLDGVRVGNTFNNGALLDEAEYDDEGLKADQNYLPWNWDSKRVIGDTTEIVDGWHRYVAQAVLQNKLNAVIASPLYTNGIGTIYFDAVNGWTDNTYDDDGNASYRLVVEIATQTTTDKDGRVHPPTVDCMSSNPDEGEAAYDPYYYGDWKSVPIHVLRVDRDSEGDGYVSTDLGEWPDLTLDIEEGGSFDHFYRVYVPVTGVTGQARFRIRRVAIDPFYDHDPDGNAYILVDNVICSTPTAQVELEPCGAYFPQKTGKQILGCEGAFTPAFPAVTDAAVYGRVKATLNGSPVSNGRISAATMHYRWHYLNQKEIPWQVADIDPQTLVTIRPLNLPAFQGDIDIWFDANQTVPYYEYVDYSGTGLGLDGRYTEEITSVTGRQTGSDWFVRTREGTSGYAEMKLVIRGASTYDMYLSEDHVWRGYLPTTNTVSDGVYWRIEPRNLQTDGATAWNYSTNYWYVTEWDQSVATLPTFPAAGRMSEGGTNDWSRMAFNAQTGYLMFQIDERTKGVTVIRADYQNFKDWNASRGHYFVGTFADPKSKKGSSVGVRTFDEKYAGWADTVSTNEDWTLSFNHNIGEDAFWTGYKSFSSIEDYFMGWQIGKGMWVHGKYREPESKIALLMAGCGEGYAEFSNETMLESNWPRGLGEVRFKARIAQTIDPEKAAFYEGDPKTMTNYTFLARTCFDQQDNEGFSGNAALSLFAYFRSGKGGYEARWEQIAGEVTSNELYEAEVLAPKTTGQRLVLVRWNWSGSGYVEKELIATTNYLETNWQFDMPTMNAYSMTNNLMPFLISAYHTREATYITAAVRVSNKSGSGTGVPPFDSTGRSVNAMNWYFVTYKDTDSTRQRFTSGNYGVLSSNCEGLFLTPQYRMEPTWPAMYRDKEYVSTCNNYWKCNLNSFKGFQSCLDDLVDGWWTIAWDDPGRMTSFYSEDEWLRDRQNYGLAYVPPYQTVDVYVKSRSGKDSWAKIGSVDVDGFGSPGTEPDFETNVCYAADCHVRLQTGGELDDYRTDVAITDIALGQWRGEDNWLTKEDESSSRQAQYGRTNIVFTTGWVTNGAVRLSARRTTAGTACSVRSPLFDGLDKRGIGLGMIGFSYREPQENVRLKVQVVTNYNWQSTPNLKNMSLTTAEGTSGNGTWLTITNLDYKALMATYDEKTGLGSYQTGSELAWYGVSGMMRVVVDDELVQEVADETDESRFGEIDIVEVVCKDEPPLDMGCWWGWNMRTIGDINDCQHRMYLPDGTTDMAEVGQSLALNNSVTEDVDPQEIAAGSVGKHMPFLQSPTFTNAVIGQISFKARKYDLSDLAPSAKIVVYGATDNPEKLLTDDQWTFVEEFQITNTIYTTYTCKTDAQNFYALRLGVVDVAGTQNQPGQPPKGSAAQRVMIDEVSISEAVRAMLVFRNVGAFHSNLDNNLYVTGVTTRTEQPLCGENWGVQAELYATMLGDEIYMEKGYEPKVRLHWYVGESPWGYANWKSLPIDTKDRTRGVAWLEATESSNLVYRSSYPAAPDAVMPAQSDPGTVVQYMLEVQYWTLNSTKEGAKPVRATNWLDSASWTVPEWYAPVDYNGDSDHGGGKTFAAYTILDTVAPGWAWINEMNIFGVRKSGGANSEQTFQFLEICVPAEADLTGWKVRMLDAYLNGKVITNNVATFGVGKLTGMKEVTSGLRHGKVFRSIGTKEGDDLKCADGTLDAPWTFGKTTGTFVKGDGYYYIGDYEQPFGVQLLRPSGTIEHSIVVIGTNRWGRLPGTKAYDPTNFVAILNRSVPGSRFFYAGEDCHGEKRTDSVTSGQGDSPSVWTNDWVATPGNINHDENGNEQTIGDHPSPKGESIIIYASVDTSFGHIRHKVGDGELTTEPQMIVLKRGSDTGTNITYVADSWYEVAAVTTNGAPFWKYERCQSSVPVTIGVGESNNLTVVGSARVNADLVDKYGLNDQNPYTAAVLSWLQGNKTLKGDFADPGKIYLADYAGLDNVIKTNLTLTQMYCLDIDPTVSNMLFKAGTTKIGPVYRREGTLTNAQVTVFMMITNRNEGAADPVAWSPYVLRGLAPGEHSWQYKNAAWEGETLSAWTSETFKVTSILLNGHTSKENPNNFVPLTWMVFHEDSFYQEDEGEHERFTAEIEVLDPHSPSSPSANYGWDDWFRHNPDTPFCWSWAIDMRNMPVGVEILQKNNYWDE